jgi:protein-disulfide isomerase-like protein with CxxC motif
MPPIDAILHTDPGCPWAYSALPALRVLDWRYGPALRWRLVVIGLTEDPEQYLQRGYTPRDMTLSQKSFRDRFGMPFALHVKRRVAATSPACRAIVAARIERPGSEWAVLRALQIANFTTETLLDEPDDLKRALAGVPGINPGLIVSRIDDADVREAYERDRAEARTAAGSAAELQGKTATTDGPVRYTAPSLLLRSPDGRQMVAGGWQTIQAYDVLVANLDPAVHREGPPRSVESLLHRFTDGLTTQEVALLLVRDNGDPDRGAAESELLSLQAAGRITRTRVGDDAVWRLA